MREVMVGMISVVWREGGKFELGSPYAITVSFFL